MTQTLEGRIVTPRGEITGRIRFGARILEIESAAGVATGRILVPGFVDLHVHGGGGHDVMQGETGVRGMAAFHLRHGTTALLATTVTAPADELAGAVAAIGRVVREPADAAAQVLGVHLEGPFISPEALGAQPPFAIAPDPALVARLAALAPIAVATVAPEIDPDGILLETLRRHGVRVQIGHTRCSYARARAYLEAGACGFTHLWNAMSGLHHREPGAAAAALAHAACAEIIADLQHVAPGALLAARRAIPGLYGVTDAVAATGMPDGRYPLGRHMVAKRGGRVELEDGTLAGSVLTMDRALRNLVALGLPLTEAVARLSTLPADRLGRVDLGRLQPGARADLLVLDRDLGIEAVFLAGRPVH